MGTLATEVASDGSRTTSFEAANGGDAEGCERTPSFRRGAPRGAGALREIADLEGRDAARGGDRAGHRLTTAVAVASTRSLAGARGDGGRHCAAPRPR